MRIWALAQKRENEVVVLEPWKIAKPAASSIRYTCISCAPLSLTGSAQRLRTHDIVCLVTTSSIKSNICPFPDDAWWTNILTIKLKKCIDSDWKGMTIKSQMHSPG